MEYAIIGLTTFIVGVALGLWIGCDSWIKGWHEGYDEGFDDAYDSLEDLKKRVEGKSHEQSASNPRLSATGG